MEGEGGMAMSVCIITVCFNSAKTIRKTLDSVKSQTWKNIDHIIIDGGSTDGTLGIIKDYEDSLGCLVSEPDNGLYDAMNKGISRATGEVVYFLNSDDILCTPEVISDVVHAFQFDPKTDLLYGNVIYKYQNRQERRSFKHISKKNILFENLCHQAVFARRRLFEKVGGFDTDYKIAADYDWILRVFFSGLVVRYLDRDIAYFNAEGRHRDDIGLSEKERLATKLRHIGWLAYKYGEVIYRMGRKYRRLASRHNKRER